MELAQARALSFDCFGTLIDWESGIWAALAPLAARASRPPDREAALAAFARLETASEHADPAPPYTAVLQAVHAGLAGEWGVPADPAADRAFAAAIADWPVFPDTVAALRVLGQGRHLVILSNVDRAGFARTLPKLGVRFDAVLTAEEIGSYKPDPRNFAALRARVAAFGLPAEAHIHVAQSLFHDHAPANAAGIPSVWIDRRGGTPGGATAAPPPGVRYLRRCASLAEFAALIGPFTPN
jgi:2-haloalkanoic acid dehalogenase type II